MPFLINYLKTNDILSQSILKINRKSKETTISEKSFLKEINLTKLNKNIQKFPKLTKHKIINLMKLDEKKGLKRHKDSKSIDNPEKYYVSHPLKSNSPNSIENNYVYYHAFKRNSLKKKDMINHVSSFYLKFLINIMS